MTTTTEEEDIRDLFNIIYAGEDWDVSCSAPVANAH